MNQKKLGILLMIPFIILFIVGTVELFLLSFGPLIDEIIQMSLEKKIGGTIGLVVIASFLIGFFLLVDESKILEERK